MDTKLPLTQFTAFVKSQPNAAFLHQPINRKLKVFTWAEVDDAARRMATALLGLGLIKGDKVGILSKNCAHWFISDLAIMMAGMVSVPIYPTAGRDTIKFVIEQSECKFIFVGKLDNLAEADAGIAPEIERITYPYSTVKGQHQWDNLIKSEPIKDINRPELNDTFSLCYTSGSTGKPKGVVLSYGNVSSAATAYVNLMQVTTEDVSMSYLPLAHITERTLIEVLSYYSGNKIFFVESLDTFIDDVKVAQPTSFLSVPRLWNKFQIEILNKMPDKKLQFLLKIPMIGNLIAKKIRKGLGLDKATKFGSGTAPISPSILQWYDRIGIPISEGWGMTETSGLASSNMPYDVNLLGSIGKACECVEMKIDDNQEILIRGPAVFKEYYKRPDATAESFTDGWFHTGDMGSVTKEGVYQIIGRLKEQFKTGKGKYVVPAQLETLLSHSKNIEQVCVMGQGRKQPIAVVVLSQPSSPESSAMTEKLDHILSRVNAQLESHQKLDHLIVLKDEWTIDNGLLTPTMKIKRNEIEKKYNHFLEQELTENIIWE